MTTALRPSRIAGWALVGGLCLAALVAVLALVSGSFDDTTWRIIGSSLGFSLFSAIGAAGESLRRAGAGVWVVVGGATVLLAGVAFLFLLVALWLDDDEDVEWLWQAWGCCGLAALAGSHASIVMRGVRSDDGALIRALVVTSIASATIDTVAGLLAISGASEKVNEGATALAVVLIVMLLTTALPPILRRLGVSEEAPQGHPAFGAAKSGAPSLTAELEAIAQRLDALDASPEVRTEAANLRRLARERQA